MRTKPAHPCCRAVSLNATVVSGQTLAVRLARTLRDAVARRSPLLPRLPRHEPLRRRCQPLCRSLTIGDALGSRHTAGVPAACPQRCTPRDASSYAPSGSSLASAAQ